MRCDKCDLMRTSEKEPNCESIPATDPPGTYSRTIKRYRLDTEVPT